MRRFLIAALLATGTIVAISSPGCNGTGSGGSNTFTTPTWGLIAYVMGRNENANGALSAVTQIQAANVNATITAEASISTIDVTNAPFTTTREFMVRAGVAGTIQDKGNISMTDPVELGTGASAFLVDAIRRSNCKQRVLLIHGHHGGPSMAVGADSIAPTTTLDLAGLDAAIGGALKTAPLAKLDIIVLDMPESANVETIAIMAKYANFLVAIEGSAPSPGFSETTIATTLAGNANIDAKSLAVAIANSLLSNTNTKAPREAGEVAAVCIDLTQASGLLTALGNFGGAINSDIVAAGATPGVGKGSPIAAIGSARRDAIAFDVAFGTNVIDLASFARNVAALAGSGTAGLTTGTKTAANVLVAAITTAVAASSIGSDVTGALGVGVFFPAGTKTLPANYGTETAALNQAASGWTSALGTYLSTLGANAPKPTASFAPSLLPGTTLMTNTAVVISGTAMPATEIQEVTLLVTQAFAGLPANTEAAIFRASLGAPDPVSGAWVFSGTFGLVTAADTAGITTPIYVPLARQVTGKASVFAFPAVMGYTPTGVTTSFAPGFVKVEPIAGVTSGGLGAYAWTATNVVAGNVARNDNAVSSGVGFAVFPDALVIDLTSGVVTTYTTGSAIPLSNAGISSVVINAKSLTPVPGSSPAHLWAIVQGFDGQTTAIQLAINIR